MENSRTKNSVYNVLSSIGIKVLTIILAFASRTVFIYVLGAVYLGLNGLFTNILSFLALSEMGLGAAISFLLYKPLAVEDTERIKTVMAFYKKCYLVIGCIIIALGCSLMPFLKYLVNLDQPVPENLYLIFFLFVLNSAVSYFFVAYKQTLIEANQKKYKLTGIEVSFTLLNCVVDIIVLVIFKNFIAYLLAKLSLVIIRNLVLAHKIDKLYPYLNEPVATALSRLEIKKIFKDVYSVFVFRLGSVLFNSVTNIVTSIMIGTIVVGYYSNYMMIVSQVEAVFMLVVTSVSAGIGNVVATESKERQYEIYKKLDILAFFIYGTCTICLFQLLNSFVNIWLGHKDGAYVMSQSVVFLICASFYTNCSCQIIDKFRVAGGYFAIGRDLQLVGGALNIILSIILSRRFGFEGVLLSPLICKVFITVVPFVARVGKIAIGRNYKDMLFNYFSKAVLTLMLGAIIWNFCGGIHRSSLANMMLEFILTIAISTVALCFVYKNSQAFLLIKHYFNHGGQNRLDF